MSKVLLHRSVASGATTQRSYRSPVKGIDFGNGAIRPTVQLEDGRSGLGTCLACSDPPCLQRLPSPDTNVSVLAHFPQDPANDLCPTNAIDVETSSGCAVIDAEACIGCGFCVIRCPYGAIHLTAVGKASVSTEDTTGLTKEGSGALIVETATRTGCLGRADSPALAGLPDTVSRLADAAQLRFVANAFALLGLDARVRRRGDTNIRFDGLLGFPNGFIGVMEIELSPNAVESPRALLEDVAVLHSRYEVPTKQIYPVSVLLVLPNARSEYYQVIQDIDNVLDIKCRTLTVGALLAMVWNLATLTDLDNLFFTTPGGTDMRPSLRTVIGQQQSEPYPGAFITAK